MMQFKMPVHRQRIITHYCGISRYQSEDKAVKNRDISLRQQAGPFLHYINKNILLDINFFNVHLSITFTKTGNQTLPLWIIAKTLQQKSA